MRQTQAVLFDLDDTLFDYQHCSRRGLIALQADYACLQSKTVAELQREHLRLLNETHAQVMQGALSPQAAHVERFRRLFASCGQDISTDTTESARAIYRQAYEAARRAVPGVIPLLKALRSRRVKLAVVTNNFASEQREKLRACGLESLVDALIVSEEIGVAKPDPAIFAAALETVGCEAGEAAMVGDSWPVDVVGAHGAGIHQVIWLNRYGLACPDPALAAEIVSFEPLEMVMPLLLNGHDH